MSRSEPPRTDSPAASWTLLVACALALAGGIAAPHTLHYRATFQWSQLELNGMDWVQLTWLVLGACSWALTPGLLVAGALLLGRRLRAAWIVSAGCSAGVLFWLAMQIFFMLGKGDFVPPIVAAWLPNLIFFGIGYVLYRRAF